mmetsp:Transcript_74516/g.212462  ORF Transcript_74516/g.212462 Transcript_74516/m.212462 type:complete len:83 (+) Transcript_74516:461-709(+)
MPSMTDLVANKGSEANQAKKKTYCYSFVTDVDELRQAQADKISPYLAAMAWDRSVQAVILAFLTSLALTVAAVYTPPECAVP